MSESGLSAASTVSADKDSPEHSKSDGNQLDEIIFVPGSDNKEGKEDEEEEKPPAINFFAVYKYADKLDYLLLAVGVTLCLVQGGFNCVNSIIFRHLTDALIQGQEGWATHTFDYDKFYRGAIHAILMYVIYGCIVFTSGFASMSCWNVLCEKQVYKIRLKLFRSIMHQEISWFDKNKAGALTTKLSDGIDRIKDGIGDKTAITITFFVQFIGGMAVAFSYSWKLSLVMLGILPGMLLVIAAMSFFAKRFITQENEASAEAGSVAEEVVNGIRTVIAFNGQSKEAERYDRSLVKIQKAGNKKHTVIGIGIGLIYFFVFFSMGVAFWYGTKLYINGEVSPGMVFATFWAFIMAMFSIAQSASQIPAIVSSRTNAADIFSIIDRVSDIDTRSSDGLIPDTAVGKIELQDVKFSYPNRPDVEVLKNISLHAEPGQVIGLVGHSGCGKSTVISLLQRFYDIGSGSIRIDGHEIKDLNVNWLRSIIGVVSQEPVLFAATIAENVRLGNPALSDQDVQRVCKISNAHEFIAELPDKYQTKIGDGGIQLSGGQKQRMAIARALAKDPRILLLDEATSALDTQSERIVQEALYQASSGRTTIMVAHRLSTVRLELAREYSHGNMPGNIPADEYSRENSNSRLDIVIKSSSLKTETSKSREHMELIELDGIYNKLVKAQEISKLKEGYDSRKEEENDAFRRGSRKRNSKRLSLSISNCSTQPELDDHIDRLEDEVDASKADPASLLTIVKFARKEWSMLGMAFLTALIRGTCFPVFSIIYGQTFKTLAIGTTQEKLDGALRNMLYFGLLGVYSGIASGVSSYLFSAAGESVTRRLRLALFSNIVSQDGTYFDSLDHSPGKLSAKLATDGPNVRAAIDQRLGDVVQAISAIISGIIIAFSYGPAMAPIGILMSGFLAFIQTAISQYLKARGHRDAKLAEEPSRLASEVIDHHRTVQSLGQEEHFAEAFAKLNSQPHKRALIRGVIQSLTFALHSGYVFFNFAAAYRFGVFLVHKGVTSPYIVFQVIEALNSASMSMLSFAAYFPEYVRARLSAAMIFKMLQDEPLVKSPPVSIQKLDAGRLKSGPELNETRFEDVNFAYPTNKKRKVLSNFKLEVPKGFTVALVGASGCGKSTVIQLIERFYDPDSGTIKLGNNDLKSLDLDYMRSNISLVSQEPILFNFSIRQIEDAAKRANVHDFITRLPNGYDTIVGAKGSQLSGGQKQRVAIARAIIMDPQTLLLDEATSALDSQSEKLVQRALDQARIGRTCVVVAHRLSTIQYANLIVVFKDGRIAEQGSHQKLLSMNGIYSALTKEQGL